MEGAELPKEGPQEHLQTSHFGAQGWQHHVISLPACLYWEQMPAVVQVQSHAVHVGIAGIMVHTTCSAVMITDPRQHKEASPCHSGPMNTRAASWKNCFCYTAAPGDPCQQWCQVVAVLLSLCLGHLSF